MSDPSNLPSPVPPTQSLHAAASDLRHLANGGEIDPDTLRAHAENLLALASRSLPGEPSDTLTASEARRLQQTLHLIYDIPEFEFRELDAKLRRIASGGDTT